MLEEQSNIYIYIHIYYIIPETSLTKYCFSPWKGAWLLYAEPEGEPARATPEHSLSMALALRPSVSRVSEPILTPQGSATVARQVFR